MEVVIITGLSGAGKSKVKDYFEDKGYYSIDNIPPLLINNFMELVSSNNSDVKKACFVLDLRGGSFFKDFKGVLKNLKKVDNLTTKLIYVEADKNILLRRYNEVRRTHPLSTYMGLTTEKAIDKEIEILSPLKKEADFVIDTSKIKVSKLNGSLDDMLGDKKDKNFTLNFMSFGYKNGLPMEADWILDARFIPNPYYIPELKEKTGKDKDVKEFVLDKKVTQDFINDISLEIETLIPFYINEGKYNLTIAIGCTGGQHRSVALAGVLYEKFSKEGHITTLEHRDL